MPHSGADLPEQPASCHQLLRQHPHLCFQGSHLYISTCSDTSKERKNIQELKWHWIKVLYAFLSDLHPAGFQVSSDLGLHLLRAPPQTGQGRADGAVYGQVILNNFANKLASLEATLFRKYDLPTDRLAHGGEV